MHVRSSSLPSLPGLLGFAEASGFHSLPLLSVKASNKGVGGGMRPADCLRSKPKQVASPLHECPHRKLCSMGALGGGEKPEALLGDLRRGGSGALFAFHSTKQISITCL